MKSLDFNIVDVFAEEKYTGNQLAVVNNADSLTDKQMQKIAREFNFSETTFILSERQPNGGYEVRIFTPATEVPFAGHPTIGTAYVIGEILDKEPGGLVKLNLKVGQIPVATDNTNGVLWMTTLAPTFGEVFDPEQVATVIGLDRTDIDEHFPIEAVSTGLSFILVPLKSLNAVKRVCVDDERLLILTKGKDVTKTIFVFCPETYDKGNQLNVRFFAPAYGVPEDPATGSANSCLAGYLVKNRYFNTEQIDVSVEQGYEMGRPSRLYLKAKSRDGQIDVQVGGKVVHIAQGRLND